MKGRYFRDIFIVRARGDNSAPSPEADEVVVYRSFMKVGLRFHLDKLLVEVLKTFEIFLHQITPEAIIRMGIFIWAMRSHGLEPNARCFCNIHELSYETKDTGKEQYHNNFGCYSFVPRTGASYPVPMFRKRWPGSWMQEWFYVKNDLVEREDIKGIIQRPIWSRFGIRRPSVALGNDVEACQAAYNIVCTYIGTRDLVQEHIAYRVWPLSSDWEMPTEAASGSSQDGLVYLKYTFRYQNQFNEPNDDWLDCIEAISDELLGAYTRAEDDALTVAFGGRGKKRLNRVFVVIGFVYPDYCYPSGKQGKKRKASASAISTTLKGKKVKVVTHRPRYIEMAKVPKLPEGPSSAVEPEYPTLAEVKGELVEVPKLMVIAEHEKTEMTEVPKRPAETKEKTTKKPEPRRSAEQPKTLSLPQEPELPKVSKIPIITPKRRRMASVLDAVMESSKIQTPASAPDRKGEIPKKSSEASLSLDTAEAGPSAPIKAYASEATPLTLEEENVPEVLAKELEFIVRHASGKQLSREQIAEAKQFAMDLKYPERSLIFNGTNEDEFLYCLPDDKEISVCQEMANSIGYPKLELDLSVMSKDQLADSLAYNSLKVRTFSLQTDYLLYFSYYCF
jgi:hypothetical protein